MTHGVAAKIVQPQLIASVRALVPVGAAGQAWGPALDQVWAFLE